MASLRMMIDIPDALIQRARAVGIDIDAQNERILEMLEREIERREAGQRLRSMMSDFWAMENKPTPEEIAAEISDYYAEKQSSDHDKSK
jgi:post-segregation antitoxin (ccd killing protein)